ncbi:putative restriction endonuclease subunit R [Candidatus Megaera venefica]|uniref:Restriction endonuclease subunit R n=1 Tax=Candidatus Megaera venefica TaxID=2055910 RepID=A0ABU5NBR4_9RICK|nr:DEAD/DEAH box helicase family protein [Candidatus Megaera venefica]MEA0970610.1 putative restriction endonuclease subunit R [Candidatus Megaera venefica]
MMKLKNYQEKALEVLRTFLESCRFEGVNKAYDKIQYERYNNNSYKPFQSLENLENVPYVCLRLPTGGGKTLLSAYTIAIAGNSFIEKEYPLTLWLVPTKAIKSQTLETLQNPNHANYKVLENAFNGKFKVFDIADFRQIRPQDISDSICIVISTFASLRFKDTEGRKAYDHDENLEPHFRAIIPSSPEGMDKSEDGKIKFSFANLLNWHRPLVIVDEAHNAKTPLSIDVLRRINAVCVIEYTATPAKNSNVITSVSASELKAEQMIKLPIILSEHISWEQAVTSSIQTRKRLEEVAAKDEDYIRPIILFQAESKDKEITVEVLAKYLIENEGIDRKQIAIVTGDQKELDSINLFDQNCQIRYVITVEALKEGWDCSFAYVLCSVANTKSAVSVEQLLGRVLRMPYAKTRTQAELNKAYAYVSSKSWTHAVSQLRDHLVNMGFEGQEAEECIYSQPPLPISETQSNTFTNNQFTINLTTPPDLSSLDLVERSKVVVTDVHERLYELKVQEGMSRNLAEKLLVTIKDPKDKKEFAIKSNIYINHQLENLCPAQRGEIFAIPQLCLNFGDNIELAEPELCLDTDGWNLLDYPMLLTQDEFAVDEKGKQYTADIVGQRIKITPLDKVEQSSFSGIHTEMSEKELCHWLDKQLKSSDIKQEILLEFLRCIIKSLLGREDLDIAKLIGGRHLLRKVLREKIVSYRKQALENGYQLCMFGNEAIAIVSPKDRSFSFDPNYPANNFYDGKLGFNKHYYSRIAMMNQEEAECASVIDQNPDVKYWVRNLERNPEHAFWLPTPTDRFYPDFVAKLHDGRIIIVEYKGGHLRNEDTEEKERIGKVWAEKSRNLFLVAWEKDKKGRESLRQNSKFLI